MDGRSVHAAPHARFPVYLLLASSCLCSTGMPQPALSCGVTLSQTGLSTIAMRAAGCCWLSPPPPPARAAPPPRAEDKKEPESFYLKELERYRKGSCDAAGGDRPLVK